MHGITPVAAAIFWAAAGILLYTYLGYPALLAAVAALCGRRRPPSESYCPPLTVLIAARNEEGSICRKLDETLGLDYPDERLEVIVVSDGSTDRTDELVRSCRDSRVRLIRVEGHLGKTYAQNIGVAESRGEVIVFSDATARYDQMVLRRLAAHYSDPGVGAVSGRYLYVDPTRKSPTGVGSIVFWNYENCIKSLQSRIRTLTGCSGCIYSVRKSAYQPLEPNLCSDLVEPLRIVRAGLRVVFEDGAVAYEETTTSSTQEFRMRVRVAARGIRGVMSMSELLNFARHGWVAFQLLSHKVLRWLVPVWLCVILISSAVLSGSSFYAWIFLLQLCFYAFACFSARIPAFRRWRILSLPSYFVTLNAAILVALWGVIRGRRYVIWETERQPGAPARGGGVHEKNRVPHAG